MPAKFAVIHFAVIVSQWIQSFIEPSLQLHLSLSQLGKFEVHTMASRITAGVLHAAGVLDAAGGVAADYDVQ